jgi:isoprenylcysteine carboxyl methyltransferase (ICMT) family protein YpbQ
MAIGPLVFGLPLYGAIFFLLNAAMLFVRIRAEEAALIRDAPAGALGDVEGHG